MTTAYPRGRVFMPVREAMEVFDGVLMSDGSLCMSHTSRNATFSMALSGEEHLDWLELVRGSLDVLGTDPRPIKTTCRTNWRSGAPYAYCHLWTGSKPFLTDQWRRWYKSGRKVVPEDLVLTPIVLANWYMGDGTSAWRRDYPARAPRTDWAPAVQFATQGFDELSIGLLEKKLDDAGVTYTRARRNDVMRGSGVVLCLRTADTILRFMDTVSPRVVPSYSYKIKRPPGAECPHCAHMISIRTLDGDLVGGRRQCSMCGGSWQVEEVP